MENEDLKFIKKHYGEKFARLCRANFSTILENQGVLSQLISSSFAPTRSLCDELCKYGKLNEFVSYIYNIYNSITRVEEKQDTYVTTETAEQLFEKAGYILYPECKTKEDVLKFKKYYAPYEELCTFAHIEDRLKTCRVWFAVKKNVDSIRRQDFVDPNRQDLYGTSVLSIQFTKGFSNVLSIKNRYNHSVVNPDATFHNNLDNIIKGLSNAFHQEFGLIDDKMRNNISFANYILANDGLFYRKNLVINNIYYCENNVLIDSGNLVFFDKSKILLIDNYILDMDDKAIFLYDQSFDNNDEFVKSIGKIEKINIKLDKSNNTKIIEIKPKNGSLVYIIVNENNEIIEYFNANVTSIKNNFLSYNKKIKRINLPNVKKIGAKFLWRNVSLQEAVMPKLKTKTPILVNNILINSKKISDNETIR